MFQSHSSTHTFTLADGSTYCVLGLGTIRPTPLITLTSVMSLPQFSFNLISMSKLTCTRNCSMSLFSDYCLIQDLLTKPIIGKRRESGGLYILDIEVPKSVACSGVLNPLNYESCQYVKLHRVHLSPRVNNRAFALFELVHSNVWGLCSVVSPTGF